ncbi:MAG: YihY/virulence factor BrkB family protein [Candidatus Aminicenantaceae bacterium]
MSLPVFDIIRTTFKRASEDRIGNHAITISYFALLCSIPVAALFAFVSTKILGDPEFAFRSLNIFSEEFFAQIDPLFLEKIQTIPLYIGNLGLFGILGSLVAASFLFSRLINSINFIFKAQYQKSFFYNRLIEYILMFIIGVIMLISLSITAIWTAIHRSIRSSVFVAEHINPEFVSLANNFFLQYLIPYTLTFLVLFVMYKFIPEIKVYTKAALFSASIIALLWEVFKRFFAYYLAHFSAIGIVFNQLVKGTLTSIIFFLLWITFSLILLLLGAELTTVLNERTHEQKV